MKLSRKKLSLLAANLTAVYLSGCGIADSKQNKEPLKITEETVVETIASDNDDFELLFPDYENIISTEVLYDKQEFLGLLQNYFLAGPVTSTNSAEKDLIRAGELYVELRCCGLSNEQIIRDMNNIVTLGVVPTELNEYYWSYFFKNVLPTVDEKINVIEYYYPLARCLHTYCCTKNHESENGHVICDELISSAINFDKNLLTMEVVENELTQSKDEIAKKAYIRLKKSNIDMGLFVPELEQFYQITEIPTDYPQELFDLWFPNLQSTLGERESLYEVYYNLALLTHLINCEYNHDYNEYGAISCMKLLYE